MNIHVLIIGIKFWNIEIWRNVNKMKQMRIKALFSNHRAGKINKSRMWIDLWPIEFKRVPRALEGSDQAHFLLIKNFDLGCKYFNRWHISDYPSSMFNLHKGDFWGCHQLLTFSVEWVIPHGLVWRDCRTHTQSWDFLNNQQTVNRWMNTIRKALKN